MQKLKAALAFLDENLEYFLIVVFYSYFVIVVVTEVVLRYAFNSSLLIAEETARYAFIWLAWIAASLAAKERLHISIQVFEERQPRKIRFLLSFVYNLLFILLCLYGIRYVLPIIQSQHDYGTLSRAAQLPMFIVFLAVPVGYTLMVLRVIQNMVIDYLDYRAGRELRKGLALF
jgi:TRAP-type C4-dicarboxylate transport system permease small subunit